MGVDLTEKIGEKINLFEAPAGRNVGELIRKNTERSVQQFGNYTQQSLRELRKIYADGANKIQDIVMLRGIKRAKGLPISADETMRLGVMKKEIEREMGAIDRKLSDLIPGRVRGAGSRGELAGAKELEILTREIPRIGFPRFTMINREAVEFYANYALETSIDYGEEALGAIKRRLNMGMVTGEAWGPVSRDVRKLIIESSGQPLTGAHYKANRIVRTEMVRGYVGGHSAYGRASDFVIGERLHNQAGACPECVALEGTEYYYDKGESIPIPVHSYCGCFPEYIYSEKLFTKEELERLK